MTGECPLNEDAGGSRFQDLLARLGRSRRPIRVHWELTARCNSRCRHCYLLTTPAHGGGRAVGGKVDEDESVESIPGRVWLPGGAQGEVRAAHGKADGELTTEECRTVLDRLAGMGILYLAFSGGEILLREDLFEIAAHARKKGFLLRLMTNGILLDAATADRIAPLHPWAVEISVYGADEQTHESISNVPGSFLRSMQAFSLLAERGVRSIMKVLLMKHNAHQYEAMKERASALGAEFRCDPVVTVREDGDRRPLELRISDDQHREFAIRSAVTEDFLSPESPLPDAPPCGMGRSGFLIDSTGNVLPCVEVRKVMGNVRERGIEDIWADPAWNEVLPSWEKLDVCRSCTLRRFCVNCRGLALNEHGDMNGPARISCRGALMRMQALVEKGALPADYPAPGHIEHR